MDTWCGHFPIISFVLRALRKKQAAADSAVFSAAESVLLCACQFWAAVATHELAAYLAAAPITRLVDAYKAFSDIGAVRVASALRVVLADRPQIPSPAWVRRHALELEARLLDTEDEVDQLIAQFASQHMAADDAEPMDGRFFADDGRFVTGPPNEPDAPA